MIRPAVAGAVHSFLNPVVPTVQHHHKGKRNSLPPKDVSVLVLNAGSVVGEASNTSYLLKRHGFATKKLPASTPANAPARTHDTIVYYDPAQPTGKAAAQQLAPLFGAHTRITTMTPAIAALAQKANAPLTVVAVGTSYAGKLTRPRTSKPPAGSGTSSAQVTDGVSLTLSGVRAENGPAHFPLMLPHAVAVGSSLSTDEGVRLFRPVHGTQELVLTFNLNGGIEYWQIEESDWTNPPLLDNPTAQFVYHRRTYYEYTSGGAISTIAVRRGPNVYWVMNTILNDLSNSTMVAIAEGLQPFH